jgi:hypothetical protein
MGVCMSKQKSKRDRVHLANKLLMTLVMNKLTGEPTEKEDLLKGLCILRPDLKPEVIQSTSIEDLQSIIRYEIQLLLS